MLPRSGGAKVYLEFIYDRPTYNHRCASRTLGFYSQQLHRIWQIHAVCAENPHYGLFSANLCRRAYHGSDHHSCTIPQRWYHNPKRIGMDQNHCRCIHGICGHLGRHFQTHADPTECVPSQATSFLGSHMVVFGMASQHARNIFLQIFICIFWLRQRQQCPGSHPHLQP